MRRKDVKISNISKVLLVGMIPGMLDHPTRRRTEMLDIISQVGKIALMMLGTPQGGPNIVKALGVRVV